MKTIMKVIGIVLAVIGGFVVVISVLGGILVANTYHTIMDEYENGTVYEQTIDEEFINETWIENQEVKEL